MWFALPGAAAGTAVIILCLQRFPVVSIHLFLPTLRRKARIALLQRLQAVFPGLHPLRSQVIALPGKDAPALLGTQVPSLLHIIHIRVVLPNKLGEFLFADGAGMGVTLR